MEDEKKQDYKRLVCSVCVHKDTCTMDKMRIFISPDNKVSSRCTEYKYINSIFDI